MKTNIEHTIEHTAEHAVTRRRLPDERIGIVHKFKIAGFTVYLTTGEHPDGTLGEIFITTSKAGSTLSGIMDAFAAAISIGLQHGVPIETFARKFIGARFEPMGYTGNEEFPEAASIIDYVFRLLLKRYGNGGSSGDSSNKDGEAK